MYDNTGRFYEEQPTIMIMQIHLYYLIAIGILYFHWFENLNITTNIVCTCNYNVVF